MGFSLLVFLVWNYFFKPANLFHVNIECWFLFLSFYGQIKNTSVSSAIISSCSRVRLLFSLIYFSNLQLWVQQSHMFSTHLHILFCLKNQKPLRRYQPLCFHFHIPWSQCCVTNRGDVLFILLIMCFIWASMQGSLTDMHIPFVKTHTLDLCFQAFIKQNHPLQSPTGWQEKKNDVGVPLTHGVLIMSTQAGM